MSTHKGSQLLRTLSLALVMASFGFCYSLATTPSSGTASARSASGNRDSSIGSNPLRFTNAFNTNGTAFDLGDACIGSEITRYVTATGGTRPYSFSANLTTPVNSSLTLNPSGCLMGSIASGATATSTFTATVTDSSTSPTSAANPFQLNLITCDPKNAVFRFAVSAINNGILGQSYISKLETLNGAAPVTFSVLPGTLTLNGLPYGVTGSLEAIGLSLATDGTISGRPTVPGLISFTARAVDRHKTIALSRTGFGLDQKITFNIEDNNLVSTDYTVLSCTVKGALGKVGQDTIKFSGVMNIGGAAIASLFNSPFTFQLGGAVYSGRFNSKGQVVNSRGGPAIFADGSQMKASVLPTGQLQGTITHATLSTLLDAVNIQDRSTRRYGMASNVCNFMLASNTLEFTTRKTNDKFMLQYGLGKLGNSIGGNFQITGIKGIDSNDVAGNPADAWSVSFLAVPRFGIDTNPGLDTISSLTVRIGLNFNQTIQGSSLTTATNGTISLNTANPSGAVVTKLSLDPRKFTGFIQTNPISAARTGIPQAQSQFSSNGKAASANFDFGFSITRNGNNSPFVGENSKIILAGQKSALRNHEWVDQNNKRLVFP